MLSSVKSVKSVVLQMRSVRAWSKTPKLLRRRASRAFAFVEKVKGEVGKRWKPNDSRLIRDWLQGSRVERGPCLRLFHVPFVIHDS